MCSDHERHPSTIRDLGAVLGWFLVAGLKLVWMGLTMFMGSNQKLDEDD